MKEKLNRLYLECIDELKSIGIDITKVKEVRENFYRYF